MKRSLVLLALLYAELHAGAVDSRYYYQDYMDFGANKGRFKPGLSDLSAPVQNPDTNFVFNTNEEYKFNFPMIDFGASNQSGSLRGEFTNIGSNRVITAAHMRMQEKGDENQVQSTALYRERALRFGGVNTLVASTSNNFKIWKYNDTKNNEEDFMVMRMTKLNLNKKALVSDIDFYDESGNDKHTKAYEAFSEKVTECFKNYTEGCEQYPGMANFKDKSGKATLFLENNQDANSRYKFFARSGSGLQVINTVYETTISSNLVSQLKEQEKQTVEVDGREESHLKPKAEAGLFFTGGLVQITETISSEKNHTLHAKSFLGKEIEFENNQGKTVTEVKNVLQEFSNTGAKGDSGSALYVYDSEDGKWYVVGVVSTSDCGSDQAACHTTNFHLVNKKMIEDFDTGYEAGGQTFAHKQVINADITSTADNVLNSNSTEIQSIKTNAFANHYAVKHSTEYDNFMNRLEQMQDDKDLFIEGGKNLTLSHKVDLGSSALIFNDNLGTYTIEGDHNFLHGGLEIGAGTTIDYSAKTAEYDFLHVIGAGKLNVKSSSENAGIRIGGGNVEFQSGNSQTFGSVYLVNNAKLKINNAGQLNTNYLYFGANAGELDINGTDLSFTNIKASDAGAVLNNSSEASVSTVSLVENNATDHIYHGQLSGNINLAHTGTANSTYVYDGGFNIKDMSVSGKNVSLQGHPVVHEYIHEKVGINASDIAAAIEVAGGGDVYTTPTRLSQEDWEERTYKINNIRLENADLSVLKYSDVQADNISAIKSRIFIGSDKAYIDKYDGENITAKDQAGTDGSEAYDVNLNYKEELTLGNSDRTSFKLSASVDLDDSSSINLSQNAEFSGSVTGTGVITSDNAKMSAKISAKELNASNSTFVYKNDGDAINISTKATGGTNTIEIKSDFLGAKDKYLLASLTNDTLVEHDYFSAKSFDSVFSVSVPNIKYCANGSTASWYLAKISQGDICAGANPNDKPNGDTGGNQKPGDTPDNNPENKPDDKPDSGSSDNNTDNSDSDNQTPVKPLDPNPSNNPSNTESIGHYKEYFFVKEKKEAIKTAEKTLNQAFFNYVLEWNNMQKRMGELRGETANAGVWLRSYGGSSSYLKQNKTKYFETQLGIDKASEFEGFRVYTGVLATFSKYSLDTPGMLDGKIKGYGAGAYASFLFDNGFYIDAIAKYTNFKNDYVLSIKNGNEKTIQIDAKNHSANLLASVEIGTRMQLGEHYFEPSAEFISGYVGKIDLSNSAEHISLSSKAFVPLNTKIMLSLGRQSDENTALGYRAGVGLAADILRSGEKTIRDLNVIRSIKGKRDARMLTNASLSYNFTNGFRIFAEFERSFFGDMNVDYSFNLTLRKSF